MILSTFAAFLRALVNRFGQKASGVEAAHERADGANSEVMRAGQPGQRIRTKSNQRSSLSRSLRGRVLISTAGLA